MTKHQANQQEIYNSFEMELPLPTLILIGVGLSSFAGAAMSLLMNLAPNPFSLSDMINWMLGSVANRSFDEITLAGPFILAGALILFTTRRGLSALTLGEEAASGIGLDLQRQRILTVVGAGLATGGAVALAGAIGFVGIVAPHIIRPLVGHDPARSLLPSALLSGLILGTAITPSQMIGGAMIGLSIWLINRP